MRRPRYMEMFFYSPVKFEKVDLSCSCIPSINYCRWYRCLKIWSTMWFIFISNASYFCHWLAAFNKAQKNCSQNLRTGKKKKVEEIKQKIVRLFSTHHTYNENFYINFTRTIRRSFGTCRRRRLWILVGRRRGEDEGDWLITARCSRCGMVRWLNSESVSDSESFIWCACYVGVTSIFLVFVRVSFALLL